MLHEQRQPVNPPTISISFRLGKSTQLLLIKMLAIIWLFKPMGATNTNFLHNILNFYLKNFTFQLKKKGTKLSPRTPSLQLDLGAFKIGAYLRTFTWRLDEGERGTERHADPEARSLTAALDGVGAAPRVLARGR